MVESENTNKPNGNMNVRVIVGKCPGCHNRLEIVEGTDAIECPFCDKRVTRDELIDVKTPFDSMSTESAPMLFAQYIDTPSAGLAGCCPRRR